MYVPRKTWQTQFRSPMEKMAEEKLWIVWICSRKHDALLKQSNLPKNDTIATKHYYVCS
jgi:hypothetical protein